MNAQEIRAELENVSPVAGRAALTNSQRLQRLQVEAVLALAEEQRVANLLTILGGSASMIEHDAGLRATTAQTRARVSWRNALRSEVRGLMDIPDE